MPGPIASFGAATTSEAVYVLGGHVGGAHEHSRENLSRRFVRYPLDDLSAAEELPGGVALQSVALVAHGDELFRVGGMHARNAPGAAEDLHSTDVFSRYRRDLGEWELLLPLPAERSSHDAVVMNDVLYLFGGWRLAGDEEERWYDRGLALDLTAEEPVWEPVEQPFRRRAIAVAAAHERLFAIGGLTPEGDTSARVDVYDPAKGTWTRGTDLPVTGFGATAFGTAEGLFFLGRDGNLWRLDDPAGDWNLVRATAFPRFFARLVPAGPGRLVAIGGASPEGRPALLEDVPTTERHDAPVVASVSWDFPGRTRQRQAAFVHDGRLYLFGGNLHAEGHRFAPEDFSDEGWSLDLLTGEWREEAPFPAARQSMRAAVLDGTSPSVLVAGGFGPGELDSRSFSDAYVFDLTSRTWHEAGIDLPLPLTQFGWAATEEAVWTAGGIAYDEEGETDFGPGDALHRWEIGDPAGFVEASARLVSKRRAFGWAADGDGLYLVGGMTEDFGSVETPERVDLATGVAAPIARPERHRLGPQVAALHGKVWVTGGTVAGEDGRAWDAALECYDPETDAWHTAVDTLPIPAEQLRLVPWGERLVAFTTAREGRIEVAFVTPSGVRPEGGGFQHP